jgi:hypothetical protein
LIPIPKNSESLKLLLLPLDEVPSYLLTLGADDGWIGPDKFLFGYHLVFDRQAVTVPSRYKRRIKAHHGTAFEDKILENHIQRVAHMGVAVGKGRPIVKMIGGGTSSGLEESLIGLMACPLHNKGRLPLGEICPHGEIGLRQKNRRTIIHPVGLGEKANHPSHKQWL